MYPNPNNGTMQLDYTLNEGDKGELTIYDLMGRTVNRYFLHADEHMLFIREEALKNGIYIYRLVINDKMVSSDKLIIIK